MTLKSLYTFLSSLVDGRVYYGLNHYDENEQLKPYITYFEVNKRATIFSDNKPNYYTSTIQITLVTDKKDIQLEKSIEASFLKEEINFQLLSEYRSDEGEIFRAYEIKMEDFLNGKQ